MELNLASYINAGYSVLWIDTPEETRIEANILDTINKMNKTSKIKRKIKIWSCTEGLHDPNGSQNSNEVDPIKALEAIKQDTSDIFVFKDLHSWVDNPKIKRLLRDFARDFKQLSKTLILISPVKRIPAELQRDITVLEFSLPTKDEIEKQFTTLYEHNKKEIGHIGQETKDKIIQAAMGLTSNEAENAFAKAIVDCNKNNDKIAKLVLMEKANTVKKSGVLEYFQAESTMDDIGGLDNLKNWLTIRAKAYSRKAREFKLPQPRGILICGLPGTGKSLCAKAVANLWDIPLIKFDISKVFAGLVGESEANWRNSISIADAIGNCVLWFDELEKGISGMSDSGKTDGGTSTRIFGNFLTWMQEKTSPVFIIATINSITNIPPELIRKGRFDEIFYVGLPSPEERKIILDIHIKEAGRDPKKFKLQECVKKSENFSGAELKEAVISGLYEAFDAGKELTDKCILNAIENTRPLSVTRGPELEEMVSWSKANAVPAGLTVKEKNTKNLSGRKIET